MTGVQTCALPIWPRFESREVGLHLAFIGSINDEILDREELAAELIRLLSQRYPEVLPGRYGKEVQGGTHMTEAVAALEGLARVRGCVLKGNEYDLKKAANLLLDDYRSGRLGRITLEFPQGAGSVKEERETCQ